MRPSSTAVAITFLLATVLAFPLRSDESSLTSKLQREVDRAMGRLPGAFVVINVTSRTILAAHRMDLASLRLEAPGSTLKPFLLMTLLETGKLGPKQQLICRRPLQMGSARMDCTHPAAVAELDTADAIAYSCNSYVAEIAPRLNGTELVALLRRAGFESPTGLVAHEARGHIKLPPNHEELQLEALGYHGIEVTPLELLEPYRKLALRKRETVLGVDEPVFNGLEGSVTLMPLLAANVLLHFPAGALAATDPCAVVKPEEISKIFDDSFGSPERKEIPPGPFAGRSVMCTYTGKKMTFSIESLEYLTAAKRDTNWTARHTRWPTMMHAEELAGVGDAAMYTRNKIWSNKGMHDYYFTVVINNKIWKNQLVTIAKLYHSRL
jgi:Penicillin binding protein transpeptidase domain